MTDQRAEPDGLRTALRAAVAGEVDFGATARALTTMDASNYRRVPLGVVAPRDADDVLAAVAVCREYGVPVVARGGGTSIAGQATGVGVVLDFTRHMNRLVSIDPAARTATVQPGLVLDRLQEAAAPHGLRFGPDPSTHGRCTIGGMVGNNSCGAHSVAWGTTADNVRHLSAVVLQPPAAAAPTSGPLPATGPGTEGSGRSGVVGPVGPPGPGPAAGSSPASRTTPASPASPASSASPVLVRLGPGWTGAPAALRPLIESRLALLRTGYPDLPRRISGYALDALLPENGADVARAFCGSEGTLGLLTEATVALVAPPHARALAVLGYADESAAADAAPALLPHGPLTVEGMAADLVPPRARGGLPKGAAWLFVETGGDTPAEARARAEAVVRTADPVGALVVTDPAGQRALWRIREDAAGTATRMPDGSEAWPGWEDCAVPPARLGAYLRDFRALLAAHGLRGTPYGHFGEGCVHVRVDFDLITAPGVARFRTFSEELADLVVTHGGSLSGEHGDGMARAELLPRMYGTELVGLFEQVKAVWDPDGVLNPGVLVRPAPLDAQLRFAVLPREPVPVEFGYPQDGGDFSAAVRRCVGVAKCRTAGPGPDVMCPSFRATGEEEHSTRGRARLLHEMLAGQAGAPDAVVTDGWRSTEVRDALDLCLSCKGCRSDCPVGVDMATYKAEFLHHHYAGRVRPAAHYAMGRLPRWLDLVAATRTAPLMNALARVRPLAALAKRLGGIAPERELPRLAAEPFTRWMARRTREQGSGTRILSTSQATVLWPDTFTDHLAPQVGRAAVRVLEDAGQTVLLPPSGVCCGLTYVSTGQLGLARAVMTRTLDLLAPTMLGIPVTVLEPSCAATLRTDLAELLPDDPRAAELAASVRTFAETLEDQVPGWRPPVLDRPVVGQTHCHQHAVLGDTADRRIREAAGLTGELSSGCCGLAGNFGFERGHYDVSVRCAEDQLLPAVRDADPDAVVLADGFSCRTQLAQLAGVRGRHLAEILADALPEQDTDRD